MSTWPCIDVAFIKSWSRTEKAGREMVVRILQRSLEITSRVIQMIGKVEAGLHSDPVDTAVRDEIVGEMK